MDAAKEFNPELKAEVNKIFADLYKEIGNNRQQLTNKVLSLHKEINKELNRDTVTEDRKKEIHAEVGRIVKMAAQQLPHLKFNAPKPPTTATVPVKTVPPVKPPSAPKPAALPKPAATKAKVAAKAKPVTKPKPSASKSAKSGAAKAKKKKK